MTEKETGIRKVDSIKPQRIQWVDKNGEIHQGLQIVKEIDDNDKLGEYWWKVMLSDLVGLLDEISGKQTKALQAVLSQFNPRTGIIIMSQRELAEIAGCSIMTMNKVVKLMCERGLIARQTKGVYCINPLFMSQGGKGRFDTLMIQYQLAYDAQQDENILPIIDVDPNDDPQMTKTDSPSGNSTSSASE